MTTAWDAAIDAAAASDDGLDDGSQRDEVQRKDTAEEGSETQPAKRRKTAPVTGVFSRTHEAGTGRLGIPTGQSDTNVRGQDDVDQPLRQLLVHTRVGGNGCEELDDAQLPVNDRCGRSEQPDDAANPRFELSNPPNGSHSSSNNAAGRSHTETPRHDCTFGLGPGSPTYVPGAGSFDTAVSSDCDPRAHVHGIDNEVRSGIDKQIRGNNCQQKGNNRDDHWMHGGKRGGHGGAGPGADPGTTSDAGPGADPGTVSGAGRGGVRGATDAGPGTGIAGVDPLAPVPGPGRGGPNLGPGAEGIGARLMAGMGYKGGGLGKQGQGRLEFVKCSQQIGTLGLGAASEIKRRVHEYKEEEVQVVIAPEWIQGDPKAGKGGKGEGMRPVPSLEAVQEWMQFGTDPEGGYQRFCDLPLRKQLMESKTMFDNIDSRTFLQARKRANPFEKIVKEMFQNRAALKMAEMDAILGRLLTRPPTPKRKLLYFADICAGPGGFSEYMFTVLKWRARGFGFTLKGRLDWKLHKWSSNAPAHSFSTHYGADGKGDITCNENMQHFAREVWTDTCGKGVALVLADGGFSVDGNENRQEYLSRQLILCQALTAMAILQKGGVFVCKVFDTHLPLTVHVLLLLRMHFRKFCLLKPNQSRPANSERYVVCQDFKCSTPPILDYLYKVNSILNAGGVKPGTRRQPKLGPTTKSDPSQTHIAFVQGTTMPSSSPTPLPPTSNSLDPSLKLLGIIPDKVVENDEEFCTYMRNFNDKFLVRQIASLHKLKQYIEDPNLRSANQSEIRLKCLAFWGLDPNGKSGPQQVPCKLPIWHDTAWGRRVFQGSALTIFGKRLVTLVRQEMHLTTPLVPFDHDRGIQQLQRPHDWYVFVLPPLGFRHTLFFSGHGVFFLDPKTRGVELKCVRNCNLRLPPDTILDVVLIKQMYYVLDAWCLPSNNSSDVEFYKTRPRFIDRMQMVHMFCSSMTTTALRFVNPHPLRNVPRELAGDRYQEPFDLYFLRGEGPKPSPSRTWGKNRLKFPKRQVRDLIDRVFETAERQTS